MQKSPIIYVAYSQSYSNLKDFFVSLIGDLGFRAEVFDFGSTQPVAEKEKQLIESSDGMIALLTPDQKVADNRYLYSQAVQKEIGMAIAAEKPIQLFSFNGVDISEIQGSQAHTVSKINSFTDIDGSDLAFKDEDIRQLFRALLEFKKRINSIGEHKNEKADFSYQGIQISQHILSSEELHLRTVIEATPLIQLDSHTHDATLNCDRGKGDGLELKDENFKFKIIRPEGINFEIRKLQNNYEGFRFNFDLDPPIQAGKEIKYAYQRKHYNYFPYTLEELETLIDEGKIIYKPVVENRMIGQDFRITQPTDNLFVSMKFPEHYPIKKYMGIVLTGQTERISPKETERINEFIHCKHEDSFDDVYTLTMKLPNPLLNHTYLLFYEPPSEGDIK